VITTNQLNYNETDVTKLQVSIKLALFDTINNILYMDDFN